AHSCRFPASGHRCPAPVDESCSGSFQVVTMINISLPDGSVRRFDKPVSGADIAAAIGPGLAKAALALKVDGKLKDLSFVVDHDASIGIVTSRDPEALELLRHDAAHVLAQAVQELYPGTQITF